MAEGGREREGTGAAVESGVGQRQSEAEEINSYVVIHELRLYFRAGATTIERGEHARDLTADEHAAWDGTDASLIKAAVEDRYEEGGYPCDGVVVIPRRLYRLADETSAEIPLPEPSA